jgi:3-methyladenine DNA glycosylase Tag
MSDEAPSLLAAFSKGDKPAAASGSESPTVDESTEGIEHALRAAGFDDVSPSKAKAFKRLVRMAMG